MLTGLNSYNSSVQYNNRPRFGQLTTEVVSAAQARAAKVFEKLQGYKLENFYRFVSMEINALAREDRKTAPEVYKELAELAKNSEHWATNYLEEIAKRASKW